MHPRRWRLHANHAWNFPGWQRREECEQMKYHFILCHSTLPIGVVFREHVWSISDIKVFKLASVVLHGYTNVSHFCLRGTSMAPLDDLIHLLPITFKDSLDTAISSVFNPTFHPQLKSRLLSVVAKEDSLNSPFNDGPYPYLFHSNLSRHDYQDKILPHLHPLP
jgi:hypothetical protein